MLSAQIAVIAVFCYVQANENAREVEGGVELLSAGEIELILPVELSFTIKSQGPFVGKAKICYAAQTTVNKEYGYHNYVEYCPPETCVFLISDEFRAHGLITERRGSVVHYLFKEIGDDMWCPRLLVNNRQNFTILELPQAPLIVNGASLPKNEETATAAISTKWIVIVCVVVFLVILVAIVVGIWFYMHSRKKPTSVKQVQQSSKSRKSHCKTSPAVVSPILSTVHHSKKEIQVHSSNSDNNNQDV